MSFFSNSKYYIKSTITSTQSVASTFLLSTDFELGTHLETAGQTVSLVLKSASQIERMEITATGGVATIVKRGLTQSGAETVDTNLQKQWIDGTIAYVTALAFDLFDKQGDTMSGSLTFTGTTNPGFAPNNLTTAQRTALTPASGTIVYDTSLQEYYGYKNGAWTPLGTGSGGGAIWTKDSTDDATLTGAINGSNTVYTLSTTPGSINSTFVYYNGQLMERVADYNISGTTLTFTFAPTSGKVVVIYPNVSPGVDTASTRATTNANALNGEVYRSTDDSQSLYYKDNDGTVIKIYDVTTNQLKVNVTGFTAKTTLVNADEFLIADSAASNVDKKITYGNVKTQLATDFTASTTQPGFVEMATDAEATAGTDQTRYVNPKQTHDLIKSSISASSGRSGGVNYQATESGFFYGSISGQSSSLGTATVYVGNSNPANIVVANSSGSNSNEHASWCVPIMKNQWYRVDFGGISNFAYANFSSLN